MNQDEWIVTLVKGHKRLTTRVPLRKFDKFVFRHPAQTATCKNPAGPLDRTNRISYDYADC